MIRRTRPTLEPLEGRSLLSGLAYSLTTDRAAYQPGQPVEMTLRETNVSSQPVTVKDGPSIDGFTVSRGGVVVWRSNAGINPLYIRLETLQPGQSLTLTATWDGIPTGGSAPVSGTFAISNQLAPTAASAVVAISSSASAATPPASTDTPPGPTPPAADTSPLELSIKTTHPTYRGGHPVRMAVILHNNGRSPVDLGSGPDAGGFIVLVGPTAIWHRAWPVSRRIAPGHSLELTVVWNGRAGRTDAAMAPAPGIYTIEALAGDDAASTTIQITAPRRRPGRAVDAGLATGTRLPRAGWDRR